jgi:hypothetical protein
MLDSNLPSVPRRDPWNKGPLIGQKRPLKPKDLWSIRVRLQVERRARNLALFNLAIDSKLRGCDLVRLQVDDVSVAIGARLPHITAENSEMGHCFMRIPYASEQGIFPSPSRELNQPITEFFGRIREEGAVIAPPRLLSCLTADHRRSLGRANLF